MIIHGKVDLRVLCKRHGLWTNLLSPRGSLCQEARGNAETGAQVGALSTSACSDMHNKAAQETAEEATRGVLHFIDTRSAGLRTLVYRSPGNCQKRRWDLCLCTRWSPANTKWQRTVVSTAPWRTYWKRSDWRTSPSDSAQLFQQFLL